MLPLHLRQFIFRVPAFDRNRMRQDINAARQGIVHACSVLGMCENRLPPRVRDLDGGLYHRSAHVHHGIVPHVSTCEQLDAVESQVDIVTRFLLRLGSRAGFGQLHFRGQVNRMSSLGKNVARHENSPEPSTSPLSTRLRIVIVFCGFEPKSENRGESPAREHLLHHGFRVWPPVCRMRSAIRFRNAHGCSKSPR